MVDTGNINTGNVELDEKIREWLKWDMNEKTKNAILKLVSGKDNVALEKLLLNRLTFGTAGLRGVMGPGYAAMNDLVIVQTSQGLAKYLLASEPQAKEKGVVIGYDARYNSHRFAELVATVFISQDIPAYLYSDITPTPFVPFGVLQLGCAAGVMVTASHNPKDDNGYKVYWSNGAQIISPHDKGIQKSIEENLEPWPSSWNTAVLSTSPLRKDPLDEMKKKYYERMSENIYDREMNAKCSLTFTFTAMHGVSHTFMVEAFAVCGFKHFVPVPEQMEPDPDFPTVKFPNPEEGKSALDLSMHTANTNNSCLILANDPDADRLAIAEKLPRGEWKVFTGNETGALLGWWLWYCYKKSSKAKASDVYMISSTVSSKILKAIAKQEGFNFVETLTGFKWMGNKAWELMNEGKTVLLAFEEAIGYMCGTTVLDKDGVGAAMQLAQLAAYLETQGKSLRQHLDFIYNEYGYHVSNNSYFICHHQPTIEAMFHRLRNFNGPETYPDNLDSYVIQGVRDLTTGYDSTEPDKKAVLPSSKSSQMITFYFENGCVATLRTSGTEPKIKYYTEFCAKPGQSNWSALESELAAMVELMVREWLQPEKNNLLARSD